MIDDQAFTLDADADDGPGPQSGEAESGPPAPRVVIEYRRGPSARLWPPLLILVAALIIVSHQRQRPIRPIPTPVEPAAPKPPPEPLVVKVITAPAEPRRVEGDPAPEDRASSNAPMSERPGVAAGDGPGAPAAAPAAPPATPEGAPEAERAQLAAIAKPAIGFVPPDERGPSETLEAIEPQPVPSREEVMEDARREADRIEAERQRLEEIKPQLQTWGLIEAYRKAQRQRAEFHDDLRQLLTVRGEAAGRDILSLCENYGRTTRPEIERAVNRALRTSHARLGRRSKVEMMRDFGWPEPRILDYLVDELDWMVNSRNGPRDANALRVRAARLLLTMPVKPPSRPSSGPASATPSGPAGRPAPRPVAGVTPAPVRGGNRLPQ
jgi:hypothetical protein